MNAPKSLTPSAENIFYTVYEQMINRQIKIKHPEQPVIEQRHWQTICYNAAFIAAAAYEGKELILDGKKL
jgi:hypothetical protein